MPHSHPRETERKLTHMVMVVFVACAISVERALGCHPRPRTRVLPRPGSESEHAALRASLAGNAIEAERVAHLESEVFSLKGAKHSLEVRR